MGWHPGCVEGVYDGVEKTGAAIAPPRGVKGDRQLAVTVFVDIGDGVHELGHLCSTADPVVGGVLDRGADPATAVLQQCHEQTVAALEVVGDTRVGHADSGGDGAYLDRMRTTLDQ